jgi:polar amino acid transport system ATP-binding protein
MLVLDDINTRVEQGELLVIVGASGSGKSTLLRCLNGLERFDAGCVHIADMELNPTAPDYHRTVHAARQHIGMVFQSFNLFGHLTALQNVMLALRVVRKMPQNQAREIAAVHLTRVGLADRMSAYPRQLSGGQQQRAAIARALAMEPRVMLYDEPTSALDPTLVREVTGIMQKLRQEGMTQILVTHEMRFARSTADRVLLLYGGRAAADLPADDFFNHSDHPQVREFLEHA